MILLTESRRPRHLIGLMPPTDQSFYHAKRRPQFPRIISVRRSDVVKRSFCCRDSLCRLVLLLLLALLLVGKSSLAHEDALLDEMEPVKEEDAGDYLTQFGYTTPSQLNVKTDGMAGDLSNVFETAVKAFQDFAHLPATGVLDIKTRKKMAEPRCGMQDGVEMLTAGGGPAFKWKKNDLTYAIHNFTPDIPKNAVREAIRKAFGIWGTADINIKFANGMHDDPWPFDKKGGVLAHATMPPNGMLHFDEAESWVYMDAEKIRTHKFTDILPVAIHEGGHALGLSHSKADESIMAPFYQEQVDKQGNYIYPELKPDDVRAIQAIYGPRNGGSKAKANNQQQEERKTVHSQNAARGDGLDEEAGEEERPRTGGGRSRTREQDDGGGRVGQTLLNKGKKALKQMFLAVAVKRRKRTKMNCSSFLPFLLFLLIEWPNISRACQCQWAPPKDNYCSADWVAHVQVVKRQDGVRMPAGIIDRQTDLNSRHEIKYLKMFKISKEMPVNQQNQVILPVNVYTATEDAACGILLESGHEYLLAGDYVNGTMVTGLCRQILLENLKESRKHDILEWGEVPQKLKEQLEKQEFDHQCS
uniref:NTR domain-containing protein n=1 Tax=Globodera rostochiensis TaxID=31243 RepID=A0A914H439_GLORO